MSKTPRILAAEKTIHENKVKTDFISAPFTQIKNEQGEPRKIPDLANNLKASFGIERIGVNSIKLVDKEFGPNGEVVYAPSNGDDRIRFIGNWTSESTGTGTNIRTATVDTFLEITFFGTGLNFLHNYDSDPIDVRASVDGGAEGANIMASSASNVLSNRNYKPNQIVNTVSGLSLGFHTVKIRLNSAHVFRFYGFEILNESAQLTVNPGKPFVGGPEAELATQQLFNTKPSSLTGTKGGRVLTYLNEDGSVGQAVTEVDATAQYLGSTNHSNEEIVRKINFREFGRNRADDFSTLAGTSNRAFTLDDGTTTLVGDNVRASNYNGYGEGLTTSTNNQGWTLTFVGTGLDISFSNEGAARTYEIFVDGTSVGVVDPTGIDGIFTQKLCSGLPYGTHTVKFNSTGVSLSSVIVYDFIIYQPKKPALPNTAVQEIAGYNVMADYTPPTTITGENTAQGTLRKLPTREVVYSGTWSSPTIAVLYPSGFYVNTSTNGSFLEYTFYGTGISFSQGTDNGSHQIVYSIDGNTDLSGFTVDTVLHTGLSFDNSTGTLTGTTSSGNNMGSSISISNLPLGVHTLRVEKTGGTAQIYTGSLDIITPIHINSPDLKTGSLALLDKRRESDIEGESKGKVDWTRAKAVLVYNIDAGRVLYSRNISSVLFVDNGQIQIYFKQPFKDREYAVTGVAHDTSASSNVAVNGNQFLKTPNKLALVIRDNSNTGINVSEVYLVFFGELESEEDVNLEDL